MTQVIVVVDDEPAVCDLLAEALSLAGALVHPFTSAAAAQAAAVWPDVDAAVIDWMMPGTSGVELARWLAERHPHIRRILLTAAPDALLSAHPDARDLATVQPKSDVPAGLFAALGLCF